jgi:hypothetical protein
LYFEQVVLEFATTGLEPSQEPVGCIIEVVHIGSATMRVLRAFKGVAIGHFDADNGVRQA